MDPLAQLSDIHLPENVHNYPIAPGWWLLAIIVMALVVYGIIKLRQYFKARKVQKQALKQLLAATEMSTIVTILKWAALQYFPRQQVAYLTGNNFKTFLIATLPIKYQESFSALSGEHFNTIYQSDAGEPIADEFCAAAKLWLSQALPPHKALSSLTPSMSKIEGYPLNNKTKIKNKPTKSSQPTEEVKS